MKRLLIVEDNQSKLDRLLAFITKQFPDYLVNYMNSYNTALSEVIQNGLSYDVIILDVSMYTYDSKKSGNGGEPEPMAGSNILRFMKLRKIKTPVIVFTMFESFVDGVKITALDEKFKASYSEFYKGYVFYSLKNDDWKSNLLNKLISL